MKLHMAGMEVELRTGTIDDVPLLLSFIHAMAAFEKLEVTATEESLRESLFGDDPAARVLLVFADGVPVAYVTYFFTFATTVGKRGLWLDDLYVIPKLRGQGIGKALMTHLAHLAVENNCARFEWMVLDWNEAAFGFYGNLGATVLDELRICRTSGDRLARVAEPLQQGQE